LRIAPRSRTSRARGHEPSTTTARPSRAATVTALTGIAAALAVVWTHWLNPSLGAGVAPLTGVALAALLLLPPRRWPLPLAVLAIVATGIGLAYDTTVVRAIAPAVAATIGAVLAATLLRIFANGPFTLRRVIDVAALIATGAAGTIIGSAAGVALIAAIHGTDDALGELARGSAAAWLGIVLVTTVVLSWSTPSVTLHRTDAREVAVLGVAVCAGSILAFRVSSDPRSFVVVLVLVWAATRFRLRGVSTAALAMAAMADWSVARQVGPFGTGAGNTTATTLATFQSFAGVAVCGLFFLAAALDERDVAEAHRAVVSDRFRRTFDTTPVGIAITTPAGTVIDANAALCRALGYPHHELLGIDLDSLRSSDEPSGELRLPEHPLAADGGHAIAERRYVAANGETVFAEVSESLVRGADGRTDSAIVIVHDVTQRKGLEEQVLHAQKMGTVGRLAGGIAHDFNNLIAVMRGQSEMLEDDLAVLDQARHRLASMQRATDRAAALTDDLLSFSRRSADEPEAIDLHEVVTSAHGMLNQLVGAGVTVELDLAATDAGIDADPRRIEQVLVNLVINASDAMPYGGRVTIATTDDSGPDGSPRALRVAVTDTGAGIPPHLQRRIFEPFFTTKPPGSGTGLGLSTADAVVRRCGGSITVDSRLGVGTTFVLTLPLGATTGITAAGAAASAPTPFGAPDPSEWSGSAAHETILVVDDEPEVRANAARILRDCGYRVLEAADAASALVMASTATAPIDVLVSDVVMPGMGGPELAEQILDRFPDVEVLFVSGYPEMEPLSPCLRGAPLLRKPVHATALITHVQHALALQDTRIRARSGTRPPAR